MSVATHSNHVFLPLPLPMTPSTFKFLHLETQSTAVLSSTWPYHSLPRLTTLSTLSIPNPCLSFSHDPLSFMVTPDIHLHIIFRSPQPLHIIHLHCPSFTSIHEHPLYTRSIYLSLYSQRSSSRSQQHLNLHKL